ncbi:MAG: transporter [Caulobacteraceae bacterium]|nr:transporter [Caulobacteraceae bacterium]
MAEQAVKKRASMATVVAASAAGTAFEWYDFFLFVPLATIMSKTFFAGLDDSTAFIFALGAFAVGFAFRPIGALIFGRIGDRIGRKATFLATMSLMGVSTFAIGLLPSYASAGIAAPILFVSLRILQGLALGGEWGGAAIYIVEHVAADKRGRTSSWLGASAALGLGAALVAVLIARTVVGETAFNAWGWRLPFLFSAALLGISMWIRLKLHESPMFQKLKDAGTRSTHPLRESFGEWANLKTVLIALFAIMIAQGAVWYAVFFYASAFLEKTVKVAPATVNWVMLVVVAISVPLYIFFGWLSDKIGRKPVMVGGMILFCLALFPGFHLLTSAGNPGLAQASRTAPVTVTADPDDCSFQFDPVGKAQFKTSCDIAKSSLAAAGVSYKNAPGAPGSAAVVSMGDRSVQAPRNGDLLDAKALAAIKASFAKTLGAALTAAGYPAKANPATTSPIAMLVLLLVFAASATALYGPQAAALVELFPTKIRYTAMSLPYHVGTGWVGGFLPATVFAIVAATGDIYAGLWYPFGFTLLAVIVALIWLPETNGKPLED